VRPPIHFSPSSQAIAMMPCGPTEILIADDDPAMLRLLAKRLEAEGYQVLRALTMRTGSSERRFSARTDSWR
jgi:hypothetical protein